MTENTRAARPVAALTDAEDAQWAAIAHIGGAALLLAVILGFAGIGGLVQALVALLGVVPSLVVLLFFRRRGPRSRIEATEAANFMITVLAVLLVWIILSTVIAYVVSSMLVAAYVDNLSNVLVPPEQSEDAIAAVRFGLGVPTVLIAGIAVTLSIVGGLRVLRGGSFRYPFALHLLHRT